MTIKKLRLENGWSQEQLAQMSGLSLRTVQRIERGQKPSLESLKCLAAVFDTKVINLMQEQTMTQNEKQIDYPKDLEEKEAIEYVQNLKGFHLNWLSFLILTPVLYALNMYVSPQYLWILWVVIPWLIAILLHGITIFGLFGVFGARWEHKQFKKRMNMHHD